MEQSFSDLKKYLDRKSDEYNQPDFILNDPISVPHRFDLQHDIEIAGFLTATLSWGQRPVVISSSMALLQLMDNEPYNFLVNARENEFSRFLKFVYRTFNGDDCLFFMHALRHLYLQFETMETIFTEGYRKDQSIRQGIDSFRAAFFREPHLNRSRKHISDPSRGAAAKRLNMFLRWMVRSDKHGVDFGIWKSINPAHLMCPLDIHSGNVARKLGLLKRTQDDWRAVEELTANLRTFDPADPVKYDFALFGIGINEKL